MTDTICGEILQARSPDGQDGSSTSRKRARDIPLAAPTLNDRKWFEAQLKRGETERFTEAVTITPGVATLMLERNTGNRPLPEGRIDKHAGRLERGEFILTHQGISFSREGILNDGQSRLTAISRTGIAGMMQVTFGAERAEFKVVDTGNVRTAAHLLAVDQKSNANIRSAVAGRLYSLMKQVSTTIDPGDVRDYAIEIEDDDFNKAIAVGKLCTGVMSPTASAIAYYWIAKRTAYKPKLEEFFLRVQTGENISGAALNLRNTLLGLTARNKTPAHANKVISRTFNMGSQYRIMAISGMIIDAWNSHIKGNKTFKSSTDEVSLLRLPEPI